MKTLQIHDEVYEGLKAFVVDPFDDTPSTVVMRLIDIAHKAQSHFCPIGARLEDRVLNNAVAPTHTHS
jgi:hypothetical protein